jgi:hypothetical protein
MSHTTIPAIAPFNNEEELARPNQFIIWLDKYIGQSDEYIMLKRSFFMAIDPTTGLYEKNLNKDDIDRSIHFETALVVQLDQVEFMFQAFDNVDKCFETIEKNLDKRIFFVTSGLKGKIIIPSLVINFPATFQEEYWMYVFCGNMNMTQVETVVPTNTWALNFLDRILMYDHQDNLLARLVLDIACYFSTKAGDLDNNQQLQNACQYYNWSKKMYQRYGTMARRTMTIELTQIDQHVSDIKERLRQQQPDSEEDVYGEACDQ